MDHFVRSLLRLHSPSRAVLLAMTLSWFAISCTDGNSKTSNYDAFQPTNRIKVTKKVNGFVTNCMKIKGFDYTPPSLSIEQEQRDFLLLLDPRLQLLKTDQIASEKLGITTADILNASDLLSNSADGVEEDLAFVGALRGSTGVKKQIGCLDEATRKFGDVSLDAATESFYRKNGENLTRLANNGDFRKLDSNFVQCSKRLGEPIASVLRLTERRHKAQVELVVTRAPKTQTEAAEALDLVLKKDASIVNVFSTCAVPIRAQALEIMEPYLAE